MLTVPRRENPCADSTGKYCSINQTDSKVWFLAGTFGNAIPINRKCTIPEGRAIFFPILVKEDSLVEDADLRTDSELVTRSREATDRLIEVEAAIDGESVDRIQSYRVQSPVFDLEFPVDNVYNVRPGLTRSVCDGYWMFIKPLEAGRHYIYFRGETSLDEAFTMRQLRSNDLHTGIWDHINNKPTFKVEVSYDMTISHII